MGVAAAKIIGQDLEHLLKLRLEEAKKRLKAATDRVKAPGGDSPAESEPDREVICEYTEALAEYVTVSNIYQDLVLRGFQSETGATKSRRRNRAAATASIPLRAIHYRAPSACNYCGESLWNYGR